jgi:uncharacterized protein involved in exopolysaccharide biosynthesis
MEQRTETIQINVLSIWRILKKEKWVLMGFTILFGLIGVIYSLSLKEEFISSGKILPEVQSKNSMGQFAGLAALAGVDLASVAGSSDAIRPELYPDVLKSSEFFMALLNQKIKDKNGKEIIFYEYYMNEVVGKKTKTEDQKINHPKSENYNSLSKQTEKNIRDLSKRITCNYDKKVGLITISAKMPDPVVAASLASASMNYLTEYIINYRTKKQKDDIAFLEEKLFESKSRLHSTQSAKANYGDQMPLKALRLQSADLQRERIESDYKISSTVYNSLLQKYEEAKFRLQQETPVIQVLEKPMVTNFRSEPSRTFIVIGFLFAGLFFSLAFTFIRYLKDFIE